jgi:hypothetical protein
MKLTRADWLTLAVLALFIAAFVAAQLLIPTGLS